VKYTPEIAQANINGEEINVDIVDVDEIIAAL